MCATLHQFYQRSRCNSHSGSVQQPHTLLGRELHFHIPQASFAPHHAQQLRAASHHTWLHSHSGTTNVSHPSSTLPFQTYLENSFASWGCSRKSHFCLLPMEDRERVPNLFLPDSHFHIWVSHPTWWRQIPGTFQNNVCVRVNVWADTCVYFGASVCAWQCCLSTWEGTQVHLFIWAGDCGSFSSNLPDHKCLKSPHRGVTL